MGNGMKSLKSRFIKVHAYVYIMSTPLTSLVFGAKKVPPRSTHRSSSVGDDRQINKNCALELRKGAWSEEEDLLLKKCIAKYGEGNWHKVPIRAGLSRCRKSCRLRWLNYLHPNIKRGEFGSDEIDLIIRMHNLLGNRWSLIAGRIPGRTANDVKNYWNTHLNKAARRPCIKEAVKKKVELFRPRPRTFSKKSEWLRRAKASQNHEEKSTVLVMSEEGVEAKSQTQFLNSISWLEHVLISGEEVEDVEPKSSALGSLSTREGDTYTSWFDDDMHLMKNWGALLESE